jgi:hypothetical protein
MLLLFFQETPRIGCSSSFLESFFLHENDKGEVADWHVGRYVQVSHALYRRNRYFSLRKEGAWAQHMLLFLPCISLIFLVSTCSHFLLLHFCIFHGSTYHINIESVNRTKHESGVNGKIKNMSVRRYDGQLIPYENWGPTPWRLLIKKSYFNETKGQYFY